MNLKLWLKYFLLLPHKPAAGGGDFDAIVAAAFGRNQYKDSELHLIRQILEDSHNFDFLAVHKLVDAGFDPGLPNRQIAEICQKLFDQTNKPLIIQWEIASALTPDWYERHFNQVFCVWPEGRHYFSTFDFARTAVKYLKALGCTTFVLVGHEVHLTRTHLIFKKLGWESTVHPETIKSFDNKSIQKFARSKRRFLLREIFVRIQHWFAEYV